jgi:ABC-type antimicrobial peptide transport system permease subunit
MPVPLRVNLRSLFVRQASTLMTVVGVGLVVMVFVWVLSLATGLTEVFRATGDPRNLIVIRAAARSELESVVSRQAFSIISTLPEVDHDGNGQPIVAAEAFLVINQPRRATPQESANVIVRGVGQASFLFRPEVRLVAGRLIRPGAAEVVASRAMAQRYEGCGLGETLVLRGRPFHVVGIFDAGRTAWDSEIWADEEVISDTFNRRGGYSSILLRCSDPAARERIVARIAGDRRLNHKAVSQRSYYDEQTASANSLRILVWLLTVVLSVGACFSAANTMYAAVSHRSREIGTLRALGFSRRDILLAFVIESLALSMLAGVTGILVAGAALQAFTGYTGTSNARTFAEVAFAFRLTPGIAIYGLILSAIMGVVGGFLPARLASRLPITQALRQV